MKTNTKLAGKDYITCGIFSALCFVAMLIAAVMNISGYTALLYPAATGFLISILFVVLNTKVQKRGSVLIFSVIPCIYFFTSGVIEGLIGAAGVLIFAGIAEAILWNNRDSIKRVMLAAVIYNLNLAIVGLAENFINTEVYCANAIAHGVNERVVEQMRTLYSIKPLWLAVIAVTALLVFLGATLGKRIMKKHLIKAGIVKA